MSQTVHLLALAPWLLLMALSALFIYLTLSPFISFREGRIYKLLFFILIAGSNGMVIWVGDNNLLFTFWVFIPAFLLCTRGSVPERLSLASISFCLVMSVCAMLDTYLRFSDHYEIFTRLMRPAVFGIIYLCFRRHLPREPIKLSAPLQRLAFGLSLMPLVPLAATVLLTQTRTQYHIVDSISKNQGLLVLPVVLAGSLMLLVSLIKFSDYEHLQQAERLSFMRELYYSGLQREHMQVRSIRHDLHNHLAVLHSLIESGSSAKALEYLEGAMGSPAMSGSRQFCDNETANIVLAAKAGRAEQAGLDMQVQISLPRRLPVSDIDLCALLGNALDNAIEAAEKAGDKHISLRCRADKGMLMLKVTNALTGDEHQDLSTTKADRKNHGFGLAGMRDIAGRYGGSLEAGSRNGLFELLVCIPLND